MLRGRIMSANGIPADELKPQPRRRLGAAERPRHHLRGEVPAGSRVVDGEWWGPDYTGRRWSRSRSKIADGLGLKLGDPVTVNVLGRNITARIANLRSVDWQSLGINFVLVFSPQRFRGAPHTDIATLTYPGGGTAAEETALLKAVADAFPVRSPRCG